jgi:hypothetical protein
LAHPQELRISAAMAAGISDRLFTFEDVAARMDASLPKPGRPEAYRKRPLGSLTVPPFERRNVDFGLVFGVPEVVLKLERQPETRAVAERSPEPLRHLHRYGLLLMNKSG